MTTCEKLSAVLITHNEELRLERCLTSLTWAHEVLVIDSGSTDRTVEIARARGAVVHLRPFDNFAAQRNWAVAAAQHAWVLIVDADEEVSTTLRDEILALLRDGARADAYLLSRENIIFGKWLRHGGHWPDRQIRLFRRGCGQYTGEVHEQFVTDRALGQLRHPLIHHSTATIDEYPEKLQHYTDLEAGEMQRRKKRTSLFALFVLPLLSFVRSYVMRRGFLDGYAGLLACVLSSFYVFVKHAKLMEHQHRVGHRG